MNGTPPALFVASSRSQRRDNGRNGSGGRRDGQRSGRRRRDRRDGGGRTADATPAVSGARGNGERHQQREGAPALEEER
jgi:hypothetical protein